MKKCIFFSRSPWVFLQNHLTIIIQIKSQRLQQGRNHTCHSILPQSNRVGNQQYTTDRKYPSSYKPKNKLVNDHWVMEEINRDWNHPKRLKYVVVNKAEKSWRSKEHFDIRHGDAKFGVCPVGFHSCFGLVFDHYAPSPMFCNSYIYSMPLYVGSM